MYRDHRRGVDFDTPSWHGQHAGCARAVVRAAAAMCLLVAASTSTAHALMLGTPQGELVLGQPLDVRVPVRMDPGLPLVADCVRFELRDGDTEVPASSLSLRVRADAGQASPGWLELRSDQALRAPFAQLTVHMECQFAQTRRYTLLVQPPALAAQADALPDGAPAESAPRGDAEAQADPPPSEQAIAVANKVRAPAEQGLRALPASAPRRRAATAHRAAASHAAAPVSKHGRPAAHTQATHATRAAHATPTSRLRLDWMSTGRVVSGGAGAIHAGSLAATASAAVRAAGVPPLPGTAAAALNNLADIQLRLQAAQARLAALQASAQANQRALALLRQQLEQEQRPRQLPAAGRASPWWHDALIAALAAACSLLGLLLWQRRPRNSRPWYAGWRGAVAAPGGRENGRLAMPGPVAASGFDASQPADTPSRLDAEAFQRPLSAPEQVQVDEVVDLGHLADFFIGLGDYDKAIEIMRRALGESGGGASALPYLYLFDLYRRTGRRDEYERLLGDCGPRLNARIPRWDEEMAQEPRDLLDYPRALALLQQAWPTAARTTVIERMIADDPLRPRVGFELPAYRDLLDLYALAGELQRSAPQGAGPELQTQSQSEPQPALQLSAR